MIKVVDINGIAHDIYNLPQGTEFDTLDLSGTRFEKLPDLSKIKVKGRINLSNCRFLASLEGLPEGFKKLDCHNCQSLTSFEGLAQGVEEIDCSGCSSLETFQGLPEGVKRIICRNCSKLHSFLGLPDSVEKLDCSACRYLAMYSLQNLPPNIKRLKCCYCDCLQTLEDVQPSIEEIDVTCCYQLKYIPDYFPNEKIKGLNNRMIVRYKQNWQEQQGNKKDNNFTLSNSFIFIKNLER